MHLELIIHILNERQIEELTRNVEPFVPCSKDIMRVSLFPGILHNWACSEYLRG
jgi:hypothetical protein